MTGHWSAGLLGFALGCGFTLGCYTILGFLRDLKEAHDARSTLHDERPTGEKVG